MQTRSSIDRLGERLKNGVLTQADLISLEAYRLQFQPAYLQVIKALTYVRFPVTGRPSKSTGAILEKLRRESIRLSQVQDIAGCRLIVDDIPSQVDLVRTLNILLSGPRIFDRRLAPTNGYRAVHLVASYDGRLVEVQVRTVLQHLWAEISEKFADTVDPALKYGGGDSGYLKILENLSLAIKYVEDEEIARAEFYAAYGGQGFSKPIRKKLNDLNARYALGKSRVMDGMKKIKAI